MAKQASATLLESSWKIFNPGLGDTLSHCPHCTMSDKIIIAKHILKCDQRLYNLNQRYDFKTILTKRK